MMTVRSSRAILGPSASAGSAAAGIVGAVGCSVSGSISSVSGRSKSVESGSRLVSPTGSSMGGGGA
jgi:hypothetical protein